MRNTFKTAFALAASLVIVGGLEHANAATFSDRAASFYASIKESPSEFNCFPNVCRAKAAHFGLVWSASTFAVCDKADSSKCVLPRF